MKKHISFVTILFICSALPLVAEGKILKSGSSGVINVPTGNVSPLGHFSLGAQYDKKDKMIGGNVTVLPGIEAAYSHIKPDTGSEYNMYSAKLQFLPETVATPGVAVGVEDITNERDRSGYVALSKEAFLGFRVHAGIGTDRFKNGFIALEKNFKINSDLLNLGLQLEYDGYDFNYGAALPIGKGFQATIGSRSKDFFAGVNYTF